MKHQEDQLLESLGQQLKTTNNIIIFFKQTSLYKLT